jgi:hypothetical protein
MEPLSDQELARLGRSQLLVLVRSLETELAETRHRVDIVKETDINRLLDLVERLEAERDVYKDAAHELRAVMEREEALRYGGG